MKSLRVGEPQEAEVLDPCVICELTGFQLHFSNLERVRDSPKVTQRVTESQGAGTRALGPSSCTPVNPGDWLSLESLQGRQEMGGAGGALQSN